MIKIIARVAIALALSLTVAFFAALPMSEMVEDAPPDDLPTVSDPTPIVDVSDAEYTYEEMTEDLICLSENSNGRLTYSVIGESHDGRKIYAAVLGDPNAEKQIIVSAGIHAREYMTSLLVMKQIEYYLDSYDTGEYGGVKYSDIFKEYAFCILPMCNPDGVTLVQEGIEGLRSEALRVLVMGIYEWDKTSTSDFAQLQIDEYLKYWKSNARGVDLNRNFDTDAWRQNSVKRPCFTDCRGESPLSEPESKAMAEYVNGLSNPVCSLAIHSRGEVVFYDCGQEDSADELKLAALVSGVNRYRVDHSTRSVAAFDDWCVINKNIPSVTVETGVSSCPLPIEEFEKIWKDNKDLWAAVAACGEY